MTAGRHDNADVQHGIAAPYSPSDRLGMATSGVVATIQNLTCNR